MHTSQKTAVMVLALAMLGSSTHARYLWNPNEQPQPVIHDNSQPSQGEHHIISLSPEPPTSHNSAGESSMKKEPTTSIQDHSTTHSDPKPTSNDHKTAASASPSSAKDPKPATAAPHNGGSSSTSAKSDTPKGTSEQHTASTGKSGSTTTTSASDSSAPSPDSSSSPISASNSSSAKSSSSTSSSDGGGSSSGLVAGIVIGIIAIIGAIVAFVMIRRKKQTKRDINPDPFTMGFGSHDRPSISNNISNSRYQQYNSSSNFNKGNETAQPYYQQQPPQQMSHTMQMPVSPAYTTPPPPLTPMSDTPPYQQQQQYYTATPPVMEKAPTTAPAATAMTPAIGYDGYQQQQQQQQQDNPPPESLGIFNVVSTYSPTLSDEVDIQLGDRIEILVEYDDGWCQGINLTQGNTKGVFPRHCVEQYPGGEQQHMKMDGPPQLELGEMKRVSSMYMTYT
ncbi:unnamed protein product [Absidia cylindrospora]